VAHRHHCCSHLGKDDDSSLSAWSAVFNRWFFIVRMGFEARFTKVWLYSSCCVGGCGLFPHLYRGSMTSLFFGFGPLDLLVGVWAFYGDGWLVLLSLFAILLFLLQIRLEMASCYSESLVGVSATVLAVRFLCRSLRDSFVSSLFLYKYFLFYLIVYLYLLKKIESNIFVFI
jgi:hypothetical protein